MAGEIKTMGDLRRSLANIMQGSMNGKVKEKEGRLAINAATRIIESFQAESRSRLISQNLKETVHALGEQPLYGKSK